MREILFRGKRADNGKRVIGGYYCEPYSDKTYILQWNSTGMGFMEQIEVIPKTVGEYSGFHDFNGIRIFEGDYIEYECGDSCDFHATVKYGLYNKNLTKGFYLDWDEDESLRPDLGFWARERKIRVIGSAHDD